MTRDEMLSELRDTINDSTMNGAWRQSVLMSLLAEGQDKFCEETGFFVDRRNYTVTLAEATDSYALDERIIQVLDVWNGATRLGKFQERDRGEGETPWFPYTVASQSGAPASWQTDREPGYLTVYPTPAAAQAGTELTLRVWRYSRFALDGEDAEGADATPEIPARFHRACIDWAAFRCFSMHDAESFDPKEAQRHLELFNYYTSQGRTAFRRLAGEETSVGTAPAYRT